MAKTYHADYMSEINEAASRGDYATAAQLEQERNEKIAVTGSKQKQTNLYSQYLNGGNVKKSTGSSGGNKSGNLIGGSDPAWDALGRAVGVGSSGVNLGAYKDANGNTSTYRPEFAGQTVQIGTQYVTYDERGYPTKSLNVKHAQSLGNGYTKNNLGLDQSKISNAADIYKGIYNALMQNGTALSGSALDNAYGKQNIQYDSGYTVDDYNKMISDAAAKGSYVLAGYLEDSKNALLQSLGRVNEQTSNYNGGWNWVDNGGGVGNIYTGALQDPTQTDQALGGGWYAGLGKGDPAEEYFHLNTDAPTMDEVLGYAKLLGYDVDDETATIPLGDLARQMMAGGYVSPETLQKAETLKITVPAVLRNLGIESDSTGTETLDATIKRMQSAGSGLGADVVRKMNEQGDVAKLYIEAAKNAGGNLIRKKTSGSGGGDDYVSELLKLYGDGGVYEQMQNELKELMDANVAKITAEYEGQKTDINREFDDIMRQYYINNENAKKNLGQQMAVYGVTGGATESALLGMNTDYQEALRKSELERISTLNELDQAIQQAKLTGDITLAEQALTLAQQRANNYGNVLQLMLNRQDTAEQQAYDRWLTEQQMAYDRQMTAQQQAYNKQMMQAELLASMGDFSGYKALGLTDAQINALGSNYTAQNTPKPRTLVADPVPVVDPVEELVGDLDTLVASKDVSRADLRSVINSVYNQGTITASEKTKLIDYYCR